MSDKQKQVWWAAGACLIATGVIAGALWSGAIDFSQEGGASVSPIEAPKPAAKGQQATAQQGPAPAVAFAMPACGEEPVASPRVQGKPEARGSAQRGLDFLAREAVRWQESHQCYGCHVQAVTVEAFSVGYKHQYKVPERDFKEVLRGMLDLNGGSHLEGGLGHSSPSIGQAAKIMGSAAFARYDELVDNKLQQELLLEARGVLALQQPSGAVQSTWVNPPVGTGDTQYTAEAIITWKQAYERSADDQWLTAIQRAEDYLHGVVASWPQQGPAQLQEINYATMGLLAAGVSPSEDVMVRLADLLKARQQRDGGWSLEGTALQGTQASGSGALATGQALYTLRLLGYTEAEPVIDRGTDWLIKHQQEGGGWSAQGFGKAEAMWAVLGLVSVDVLTVSVDGLRDGQRVQGKQQVAVQARDNQGGGVAKIEVMVDDLRVYGACGAQLAWSWDTGGLAQGKHVVDIRATNARGEVSRRRFEVYAGDVFLTQVGSRYTGGQTEVSLRNIGDTDQDSQVKLEIFEATQEDGVEKAGRKLRTLDQQGQQGAQSFLWDGKDEGGAAGSGERYMARLSLVDKKTGEVRQTTEQVFVHASAQAQAQNYAQIQGAIELPNDEAAANVELELVDQEGNVVQRTWSTRSGNYRFRNVAGEGKKFKVRARKEGFVATSGLLEARPAAAPRADMKLMVK